MQNRNSFSFLFLMLTALVFSNAVAQQYKDKPFSQDYSIKYYADTTKASLRQIASDRNGVIQILAKEGLQHVYDGQFLYPGTVEPDRTYRFMKDKNIAAISEYQDQLIY